MSQFLLLPTTKIVCCHVFPLGGIALHIRLVWNHREQMLHGEHGAKGATGYEP